MGEESSQRGSVGLEPGVDPLATDGAAAREPVGKPAASEPAGTDAPRRPGGDAGRRPSYPGGLAEATVVGRAQEGDVDAFEMVLRQYQTPLYRLARRLLGDDGGAEDIVQDTFIQAWRRLPSLTELEAFRSWIYQITTRRCLDLLRTRSRRKTDATDAERMTEVPSQDTTSDPQAAASYHAHLQGLADHLGRLPDDQRACWVLRELHGLSYHEIAFAMRLPVSTVRGRIARARQNLMRGMESWR